jgi:hypothetical protein
VEIPIIRPSVIELRGWTPEGKALSFVAEGLTVAALALAVLLWTSIGEASALAAPGEAPRLILLVAVGQMRYDYLPRFADLDHYPSVTAVGHAARLTGAPPSISGIIGNDWYDRALKRNVTSVEDPATRLLGGREAAGCSPHRLRVSAIGDELKMAHPGSRVIGISHKDRSAILMAGRMADLALWWDMQTGAFVSSTWYVPELPKWAAESNAGRPADAWLGREWRALGEGGALLGRMRWATTRGRTRPRSATSRCAPTSRSTACSPPSIDGSAPPGPSSS